MTSRRRDPWNLSQEERRALSLIGVLGCPRLVAEFLSVHYGTVVQQLHRARKKMAVHTTIQAALRFERWKRGWSAARAAKDVP